MSVQRRSLVRKLPLLGLVAIVLPSNAFLAKLDKGSGAAPYKVVHSDYAAVSRGAFYRLSWIDNDRVFFAGEPIDELRGRFDGKRFVKSGKIRFLIWDTRANEVLTYRDDVGPFGAYCYNELENWIRYPVPGKDDAVMEGKLGEEKVVEINAANQSPAGRARRGVFFHDLTCREHPYAPKNVGVSERRVFPLFLDHGVLDIWGKRTDLTPIRWFSNGYEQSVEFDLVRRAVAPEKVFYSKYLRSYVLTGYTAPPSFSNDWGSWPSGVDQPVYALSVTRQLALLGQIPWRQGFRAALAVFPTAKGLIYASGRPPKDRGVFLVNDGKAVPLLRIAGPSSIFAAGVSPDGCKVAVALSLEGADKYGGVKVIELCPRGTP
jgi:hypothetical protein